jgi:hypothetical protein
MTPPTNDELLRTIRVLDTRIWQQNLTTGQLDEWMAGFDGAVESQETERHLALALLSRFTFFGVDEVRVLLRSLFEDVFRHRLAQDFRRANNDTTEATRISRHVTRQVKRTIFVGAGNPAESGAHILYYFRQVNELPLSNFAAIEGLLNATKRELAKFDRIVLLDDICGSGKSAKRFGSSFVGPLQERRSDNGLPPMEALYLTLCGTEKGLKKARGCGHYDDVHAALMIDESHRAFSAESRYFPSGDGVPTITTLTIERAESVMRVYGKRLLSRHPLGFDEGQLLLGFGHNIPNNTLPIFWFGGRNSSWQPVFKRYAKRYD